ncbi:MAG: hypothetical protein Q9207_003670, partial [Kuettlingeria erythrocarpa]
MDTTPHAQGHTAKGLTTQQPAMQGATNPAVAGLAGQHPAASSSVEKSLNSSTGVQVSKDLQAMAASALTEFQKLMADIVAARKGRTPTLAMTVLNDFSTVKDILDTRISEYDAALQVLKDGHHDLAQKCKDREQQLGDLERTLQSKTEEETSLRSAIDQLKYDQHSITPKLLTSKATLDWVENKVKELRGSIKSLDQKRAQDDAALETKRSTIQKERQDVDSKLESIEQKQKEHDARVAGLGELQRVVNEAAGKNNLQLATFASVMTGLRSALDLVDSPPTFESVQDDAQAIADVLQKTLESLKTQVDSQEKTLALKDESVETLSRQLEDAETSLDLLQMENDGLQNTIGSKDQELQAASTKISGLRDRIQSFEKQKAQAADALGAVQRDLDEKQKDLNEKQKEVDAMAREKGRADDLDKRNQTLQSDLHTKELELDRLKGVDLQARQLDEKVKALEEELTSFKNQKSAADWEVEVSNLTEQTKSLGQAKGKADASYKGLQAFSDKQVANRMKLEQEVKSHEAKALDSTKNINQLKLELMTFKKQRPSADWEAEVSSLTEQVTGLTDDKTNLTTRIQSLQSEAQKRTLEMGQLDTRTKSLDKQISAYKTEMQKLKDRARQAETAGKDSVTTLTADKEKLEKELTVFRQQKPATQWNAEVSALSSQVNTLSGEKHQWESLHTSDQGKITGLETQVKSLQTELSTKTRDFQSSERKKVFLENYLRRLHSDVCAQVGEQLGMGKTMDDIKAFVKTQQNLNTMVKRFYHDAIPTGPADSPVAALPALHITFSNQRNTVARLNTEHRQLKEQCSALGQRGKQLDQDLRSEKEQQARSVQTREHQVDTLNQSLEKEKADKAALQKRLDDKESQLEAARVSYKELESQKIPGPDADEEDHMETLRQQLQTAKDDRAAKEVAEQEAQRLQRSVTDLQRELTRQNSTLERVLKANTGLSEDWQQIHDREVANKQRVARLESAREDATERINGLEARIEENDRQHRHAVVQAREPLLSQISRLERQVSQLQSASGRPAQEPFDVPRKQTKRRSEIPDSPLGRTGTGLYGDDDLFQGGLSDGEDYGPIRMNLKRKAIALNRRQGTSPSRSITNESAGPSDLITGLASETGGAAGYGPDAGPRKRPRTGMVGLEEQVPARNTPASDGPVNEPPWKLDEVRQPGFRSSSVPAIIVSEVQERIKEWDRKKPNWYRAKGGPKCANQHVGNRKSVLEGGEACQQCIRGHNVCVKLKNGTLEPLPLPATKRGTASPED